MFMDTIDSSEFTFNKTRHNSSIQSSNNSEFDQKISQSDLKHNYEFIYEYDPIGGILLEEKISKNFVSTESVIIELFKKDYLMDFEEKINLARIVLNYFTTFGDFPDFYEEECHLAMVNWIYKCKKYLDNDNDSLSQIYELLNIILNIFEILPIKVEELFSLNIYEKLNKIRKIIKNKSFIIHQRLDALLTYWSSFCEDKFLLKKKKGRDEINELEIVNNKKACYIQNFITERVDFTNKIQNYRKVYPKSSVYNKGILKTSNHNVKKDKKSVQWKKEEEINQINIFKYYDTPSAGVISREEYESINNFISENRKKNVSDE